MTTLSIVTAATAYPNAAGLGISTQGLLRKLSEGGITANSEAFQAFLRETVYTINQGISVLSAAKELAGTIGPGLSKTNTLATKTTFG
jgi:hypothetical protein